MTETVYGAWARQIAGEKVPLHEGKPHAGYFFHRLPNKKRIPIHIYPSRKDASLLAWVGTETGGKRVDPVAVWVSCCEHPVTQEAWLAVYKTGQWPDEAVAQAPAADGAVPITHNAPPEPANDMPGLKAELADLNPIVKELTAKPVATKNDADRAANLRTRLRGMFKKADTLRLAQGEPHRKALAAIQAEWKPLIDNLTKAGESLGKALTPFLQAEETRQRAAAAAAVAQGAAPAAAAPAGAKAGGAVGRATTLRTYKVAEITDYAVLLAAVSNREEIRAAVQAVANACAVAGVEMPGMKIREEKRAAG